MGTFFITLLVSLLLGSLTGISVASGVVVYLHDIVLCIGLVYFGVSYARNKKFIIPRLWKAVVYFVGAGILSLIVNGTAFPFSSLVGGSLYLWRWVAYTCLYVLLIQGELKTTDITKKLFAYGCAFGAIGLLQFALYPNLRFLLYLGWDPHYYRLFSTVLDPNFAGIILVLSVLLGYYLFTTEKKTVYGVALALLVLCVYLTYSRSSYLAMATGACVYGLLQKKWKVLGIIGLFIGAILLVPRPGGDTLRLWREDSTYSRFSNWKESSAMFLSAPLFGHGFNTLRYIQTPPLVTDSVVYVSHAAAGVDSSILFLLVTSGVVGLCAYGYLLYLAGVYKGKKKDAIAIQYLYISCISALLIHSLFVNSMFYPWVLIWFWILMAAVEITYDR